MRQAAANLEATQNSIQGILDGQAADAAAAVGKAEAAKNKIIEARKKADQAVIDALSLREQRLQNRLLAAEGTPDLQDDIKRATALSNFYKRKIAEVRKVVQDATLAAQIIVGLVQKKPQQTRRSPMLRKR